NAAARLDVEGRPGQDLHAVAEHKAGRLPAAAPLERLAALQEAICADADIVGQPAVIPGPDDLVYVHRCALSRGRGPGAASCRGCAFGCSSPRNRRSRKTVGMFEVTTCSRPRSSSSSMSHFSRVMSLCAIMKVVRPSINRLMPSRMPASVCVSTELVGSSKM